jgi:hypothetical protein
VYGRKGRKKILHAHKKKRRDEKSMQIDRKIPTKRERQ